MHLHTFPAAKAAQKAPPLIASRKVRLRMTDRVGMFRAAVMNGLFDAQVVNNITKWSQVQEELKQNVPFNSSQAHLVINSPGSYLQPYCDLPSHHVYATCIGRASPYRTWSCNI